MVKIIDRKDDLAILKRLIDNFPVIAILGARQSGKTTIAKKIESDHYFDLENPQHGRRFENPQLTLEGLRGLIIIDEIQRMPELFPLLRYIVDTHPEQKYLILGSASRDLIKQSSESLAGRIAYYNLGGLRITDFPDYPVNQLWLRGGFPRSYLSRTEEESDLWRENYIKTFLERDIPQLGINIPARTIRRFWIMLSHYHGQILNYSELGRSFGISDKTVKQYIDILEGTFMIRVLMPWHVNVGKRLVKSPKLYLRDSGIFHSLQAIDSYDRLLTHNKVGASWEGFVIEEICKVIGKEDIYYWRTHTGAELDLFWQNKGENWGVEVKYADAPRLTKSIKNGIADLDLKHLWVIYPGMEQYQLAEKVTVLPFSRLSIIKT